MRRCERDARWRAPASSPSVKQIIVAQGRPRRAIAEAVQVIDPQVLQHGGWRLLRRDNWLKRDHLAPSSYGADFGLLKSAMTNFDSPASSLTVSVKSFVSGLSKLKTMGR
jgi:hypothetical protein